MLFSFELISQFVESLRLGVRKATIGDHSDLNKEMVRQVNKLRLKEQFPLPLHDVYVTDRRRGMRNGALELILHKHH
jgi:hypothetical protein